MPPLIPLSRVANIRSVHTLASVQPHWDETSLPCLAFGTPGRLNCPCVSFTFPPSYPLGSTVVARFFATMGALTPALLLHAPGQVSLITDHALPDIQSPPTPCAPVPAMLLVPGRLCPRFAWAAIGGSSDFAHYSQSRQSHQAVSSLLRRFI